MYLVINLTVADMFVGGFSHFHPFRLLPLNCFMRHCENELKSDQKYLAFLEKQKFVNKSFASSNMYFTSENFPLINEDGDISNSLD